MGCGVICEQCVEFVCSDVSVSNAGRKFHYGRHLCVMGHIFRLWDRSVVLSCV